MVSGVATATEIGTSCNVWARLVAVTMMSPSLGVSVLVAVELPAWPEESVSCARAGWAANSDRDVAVNRYILRFMIILSQLPYGPVTGPVLVDDS